MGTCWGGAESKYNLWIVPMRLECEYGNEGVNESMGMKGLICHLFLFIRVRYYGRADELEGELEGDLEREVGGVLGEIKSRLNETVSGSTFYGTVMMLLVLFI